MQLSVRAQHIVTHVLVILSVVLLSTAFFVYVQPRWGGLGAPLRLVLTLGVGLALYGIAVFFYRNQWGRYFHVPLLIIASIAIPNGIQVAYRMRDLQPLEGIPLNLMVATEYTYGALQLIVSGIMFTLFLAAWYWCDSIIALVGLILYGTGLYFNLIRYFEVGRYLSPYIAPGSFQEYVVLSVFLGYVLISYLLERRSRRLSFCVRLVGLLGISFWLYNRGNWFGWSEDHPLFSVWRVAWPFFGAACVTWGIKRHDNALLIGGMVSLIAFIFTVAWKYGREALGVPLLLTLLGVVFLALSYGVIRLTSRNTN